jgi:hypothetical protein
MVGEYRDGPLGDIAHQADLVHVAPVCERHCDDRERILEKTGRPMPMGTVGRRGALAHGLGSEGARHHQHDARLLLSVMEARAEIVIARGLAGIQADQHAQGRWLADARQAIGQQIDLAA